MNETKAKAGFTPGPWTYDPYWSLIHGPKAVEIAAVHAATQHGEKRARLDTAQANARLIAAAPAMYEALKELVAFQVNPELSEENLQKLACGEPFIPRLDKAKIGYLNTPFRDNAHALRQAMLKAKQALALADGERGRE